MPFESNTISPTSSAPTLNGDSASSPGRKRKEAPLPSGRKPVKKQKKSGTRVDSKADVMTKGDGKEDGEGSTKSKRVRTGCLTCRSRHLKCDEGWPDCNNCRKSNRTCERGVRLNFIDTWAEQPPKLVSLYGTREWKVEFQDESREIASEYQGGLQKYGRREPDAQSATLTDPSLTFDYAQSVPPAPNMGHQTLPPIHGIMPDSYPDPSQQPDMGNMFDAQFNKDVTSNHLQPPHSGSTVHSSRSGVSNVSSIAPGSVGSYSGGPTGLFQTGDPERKEFIDNQEDTLFSESWLQLSLCSVCLT